MDESPNGYTAPASDGAGGGAAESNAAAGSPASFAPDNAPARDAAAFLAEFQAQAQTATETQAQPETVIEPVVEAQATETAAPDAEAQKGDSTVPQPAEDDPNVDISKLPPEKVVEDLRAVRQLNRTLEPKAKGFDRLSDLLKQHDLREEELPYAAQFFAGLSGVTEIDGKQYQTTAPFLDALQKASRQTFDTLKIDLAEHYSDEELLAEAQGRGLALAATNGGAPFVPQAAPAVNEDLQALLDTLAFEAADKETLKQLVRELDPAEQLDLVEQNEVARRNNLNRILKEQKRDQEMAALKAEQQQRAAAEAKAQAERLEQEKTARVEGYKNEQAEAFFSGMQKDWTPFGPGPEHTEDNQRAHLVVYNEVAAGLRNDPALWRTLQQTLTAIKEGDALTAAKYQPKLTEAITSLRDKSMAFWSPKLANGHSAVLAQHAEREKQIVVNGSGGFADARQPQRNNPDTSGMDEEQTLRALAASAGIRFA